MSEEVDSYKEIMEKLKAMDVPLKDIKKALISDRSLRDKMVDDRLQQIKGLLMLLNDLSERNFHIAEDCHDYTTRVVE